MNNEIFVTQKTPLEAIEQTFKIMTTEDQLILNYEVTENTVKQYQQLKKKIKELED